MPSSPRKPKPRLLGSHQKCWLWGRHAVRETLHARRWPILELHLADRLPAAERTAVEKLAQQQNIKLLIQPAVRLEQLCHSPDHQGYLAKLPPFPYDDPDDLLRRAPSPGLFLILAALHDPFNFGAILRSAEVLGCDGVFVGTQNQADVTVQVVRSSAGAINRLPLARTLDLCDLIPRLKKRKIRVVAASEKSSIPAFQHDFCQPTAIVIGNEGTGIPPEILSLCDRLVTIPQSGQIGSLNAAVAAALLIYEARRQRLTAPQ